MKKIGIILLSLVLLLSGCATIGKSNGKEAPPEKVAETTDENLTETSGILKTKYIENNKKYIELTAESKELKLDATSVSDFEILENGQELSVTYNENNVITQLKAGKVLVEEKVPEENNKNKRIISINPNVDLEGLTEYSTADLTHFSQFGIDKVSVYTDAQKDSNGKFMWDDGNRFVLVAHKGEGGYVLFDERVQIGALDVNVFSEGDQLHVSLLDYGTAHLRFRIFTLVGENFEEDNIYNGVENINMIQKF